MASNDTTTLRRLVLVRSNAADHVLLVAGSSVLSAWVATDETLAQYRNHGDLDDWEEGSWPDGAGDTDCTRIADWGVEVED